MQTHILRPSGHREEEDQRSEVSISGKRITGRRGAEIRTRKPAEQGEEFQRSLGRRSGRKKKRAEVGHGGRVSKLWVWVW
jgi:hypothetical protein